MDLQQCRERIDEIDEQIVRLFCERMKVVEDVAAYKRANNLPVLHPAREAQVLDKVAALAGQEFGESARALYVCIMALSKDYQHSRLQEQSSEQK